QSGTARILITLPSRRTNCTQIGIGKRILVLHSLWIIFGGWLLRQTFRPFSLTGTMPMRFQNGRDAVCRLRKNGKKLPEAIRVCVIPGAIDSSEAPRTCLGAAIRFWAGAP